VIVRRALPLILLAVLVLAGCGSKGKQLPPESAALLTRELGIVQAQVNSGASCNAIRGTINRIENEDLPKLPSDVDGDLRDALNESFSNLGNLVESDCQSNQPPATTETTPPPTTTTEQTQTQTTPANTQTQTTPETKPKKNKGNGNQGDGTGAGNNSGGASAPGGG
jgi:hypothetical protein